MRRCASVRRSDSMRGNATLLASSKSAQGDQIWRFGANLALFGVDWRPKKVAWRRAPTWRFLKLPIFDKSVALFGLICGRRGAFGPNFLPRGSYFGGFSTQLRLKGGKLAWRPPRLKFGGF